MNLFSRFRVRSIAIYWTITERIYLLLYIGFFAAHKRNSRIGKFQVPLGPLIPVLSILFNVCLLLCFSVLSLLCFVIWILIGKLMYYILFIYMHEDKVLIWNLSFYLIRFLSNPFSGLIYLLYGIHKSQYFNRTNSVSNETSDLENGERLRTKKDKKSSTLRVNQKNDRATVLDDRKLIQ